jgi:RNA polymerase sigma factor (sigma-70 family)
MAELLSIYRPPIYGFFRRRGFDTATADDLTQDFIRRIVIGKHLPGRVKPGPSSRFRSYLLRCLQNFVAEHHRSAAARRDKLARPLDDGAAPAGDHKTDAAEQFERDFDATTLKMVVDRMEHEWSEGRHARDWEAFRHLKLLPLTGGPQPTAEAVASRLGMSRREVYAACDRVKAELRERLDPLTCDEPED